jgi:metallophosphoesterase superfamily enzyme
MDYHLGVDEKLFYHMMNLFALDKRETEKLIEKWFEKNYPNNFVISAFPIIE